MESRCIMGYVIKIYLSFMTVKPTEFLRKKSKQERKNEEPKDIFPLDNFNDFIYCDNTRSMYFNV